MSQASDGGGGSVAGSGGSAAGGVPLLASGSRSGNGTGAVATPTFGADIVLFMLNVYQTTGSAGTNLRVWVQQTMDGTNWDDVVAFPSVSSGSAGGSWVASMTVRQRDQASEIHALQDAAMAAGTVANITLGRTFRVKWTAGADAFGFQVLAATRTCD
jgi:hypothetical protein